jgi:DNA-binding CsgD family transcriptional regulator
LAADRRSRRVEERLERRGLDLGNRTEDAIRNSGKLDWRGGRCAAHRKTAVFGWIVFVVAAIAIGGALGTKTLSDSQTGVGESAAAGKTLETGFPHGADESVLVQSRGGESAHGPHVKEAVRAVEARLRKLPFVAELVGERRAAPEGPLDSLSPREREVLSLMAEGRTNNAIAEALVVTPGAVEKHVSNIFSKLDLAAAGDDHRRVLAVLAFLRATDGA